MNTRIQQSLPAVAAVLAGSMLLGVAYNSASPLGVRNRIQAREVAAPSPKPSAATPVSAAPAPAAYENQTLAMLLMPTAGPTAPKTRSLRTEMPVAPTPPGQAQPTSATTIIHPPAAAISALSWPQVKEAMAKGNVVLVDARAAAQYQAEHIPGAVSLPASAPAPEITAFIEKHGKEKTYIVYCGSGQCGLSKTVANSLRQVGGATDVKTFPGGYAEYRLSEQKPAATP